MINIESAIIESKNKPNISDGGSKCFDFDDVVLVKYSCPTKYLKNGERSREESEEIMNAINIKADSGVNTPRHIAVKRVIEGANDICYVLQEKCPGYNCSSKCKYDVSFDEMCDSLKFVLNIPFEHYRKLYEDGFTLFEMGYEAKNKNLFYDLKTGFWFIDFLSNDEDYLFDSSNVKKVFEALKYRIPKPIQISSTMRYGVELTDEQLQKQSGLEYSIKAKTLLAIKAVLPNFERYEKFFLFEESEEYKRFLMREGIVNKDLMNIEPKDYEVFLELYEIVMNGLIDNVVNKGEKFWSIECNAIRNDSQLFNLQSFFKRSKYNSVNSSDFDDMYDYEDEVRQLYTTTLLTDLINRIKQLPSNDNIINFLSDAEAKFKSSRKN